MSRFADNLRTFWSQFLQSLTRFPVEALLGVTYFILFLFAERIDAALEGSDSLNLFLWFFPHCVLVFTLHRSSEGRPAVKALYYLSWFLWIPLLFFCTARHGSGMAIFVSYLLAAILLVVGRKRLDNGPFAREILRVVVRVGICFLIGGLLLAVVTAIISSVGFLFGLKLGEKWFEIPNVFIALNIIPLMCCSAASDERPVPRGERILQTVVDRILSPALIIYTLILYAYTVRILVRWELPDGGVAYMVSAFIAVALLCILFQPLIEKSHFTWFYKAFPALAVAPLALLWTGVFRRVSEYGLTESRVYLILFAALMTLFVAMLTTERGSRFQLMALILAAATALFTFIPGIRAKDFGIRSQQKRLEAVLPQVLEDGRLPAEPDYAAIAADSTLLSSWKTAESTWRYLRDNMSVERFEEMYGRYGSMSATQWLLDHPDDWEVPSWDPKIYRLGGQVDLSGYTVLVPSSEYHYHEDGETVIFYSDSTKQEELLRCEILQRLDKAVAGNEPLIYMNDRYMAVFTSITDIRNSDLRDHNNFHTGMVTLFRKPE